MESRRGRSGMSLSSTLLFTSMLRVSPSVAAPVRPCGATRSLRRALAQRRLAQPARPVRVHSQSQSQPSPEQLAAAKAQYEYDALMADPVKAEAFRKQQEALAKAMETPEAQKQQQEMAAFMNNPAVREKLLGLKDDPEFKDFFDALKTGGPQAMLKFWDDEVLLAKISQRLGSAGAPSGTAGPPPAAAPAPPEEVTNLFEAARWGDLEAVEDFIAVGKDVNAADKEGRRPLHVAVAYGRDEPGMQIVQALLEAGAQLEAVDVKMNTALHYAAGYGRAEYARMLLDAGADASRRNETGKSALELVRLSPKNPVREDAELMARLEKADSAVFFRDS